MYGVISMRLIVATGGNFSSRPKPWVAHITGICKQFGFEREFMRAIYDYTNATRNGKNTRVYYFLPPGIYETKYPVSWKHDDHFFFRVNQAGEWYKIDKDEVLKCLKNAISE